MGETDAATFRLMLNKTLVNLFDIFEMYLLCGDIGIDYQSIPYFNRDKGTFANELILYAIRHDKTQDLVDQVKILRPGLQIADPPCDLGYPESSTSKVKPRTESIIALLRANAYHEVQKALSELIVSGDVAGEIYLLYAIAKLAGRNPGAISNESDLDAAQGFVTKALEDTKSRTIALAVLFAIKHDYYEYYGLPSKGMSLELIEQELAKCSLVNENLEVLGLVQMSRRAKLRLGLN